MRDQPPPEALPPGWVYPFVMWAEGRVDELDFGDAKVPERLLALIADAVMTRAR